MKRYFFYQAIRLFRIRARSEKIARGFALGIIINFLPTFGFGVVISGFVARLFGGHSVAGFVGGATLTFAWPILFALNVKLGAFILEGKSSVGISEEVTEEMMNKLVWGRVFVVGMIANMLAVGLTVYLTTRLLYRHIRPVALRLLRRHIRARPSRRRD